MGLENESLGRQYDFSRGPNYSTSIFTLAENELAESDNVFHDGILKTIPGAARIIEDPIGGSTVNISGVYHYRRKSGTNYFLATSQGGRIAYQVGNGWSNISTTLSTVADTFWSFATFNDTFIGASLNNTVKKWDATTFTVLGGTPPQSKFVSVHGDYLFLSGHTSNPSQIRYSASGNPNSWPVGNTLSVGVDDGNIITGTRRYGDQTIVFKEGSIWAVSGRTSAQFAIDPVPSLVGAISNRSIVVTDAGIFFWSEAGPALFTGYQTILLGGRIRSILDDIDWTKPKRIHAEYYPYRRQVLISYQRSGQSSTDRMLIFDVGRFIADRTPVFWPVLYGSCSMGKAEDTTGRNRVYLGLNDGRVCAWDSGVTFNGAAIASRIRTRPYMLSDRLDKTMGVRTIDLWMKSTNSAIQVDYATDGDTTFSTHAQTPISMLQSGGDMKLVQLNGDGNGNLITAHAVQLELSGNTQPLALHGLELGIEDLGKRRHPASVK